MPFRLRRRERDSAELLSAYRYMAIRLTPLFMFTHAEDNTYATFAGHAAIRHCYTLLYMPPGAGSYAPVNRLPFTLTLADVIMPPSFFRGGDMQNAIIHFPRLQIASSCRRFRH